MTRTTLIAELLRWARGRFGVAREELAAKFTKLPEWEDGVTPVFDTCSYISARNRW